MMDNDKWVWGDTEESSPVIVPLFEAKLTPIIEWPNLEPEPPSQPASPEPSDAKPEEKAPAANEAIVEPAAPPAETPETPPVQVTLPAPVVEAPQRNRKIPPSVMRAI